MVEKHATLAGRMSYRKAVVTTKRISGWVCVMCVLALGIFQAVGVLGLTLDLQSVLQAAVWCLIAAMMALIVHLLARRGSPIRWKMCRIIAEVGKNKFPVTKTRI